MPEQAAIDQKSPFARHPRRVLEEAAGPAAMLAPDTPHRVSRRWSAFGD